MACDICKHQDDSRTATKQLNRALRIVNRNLRRREAELVAQRDEVVESLLATPNEAEESLREIWEKAGMKCSPDDYPSIVEGVLFALGITATAAPAQV